MNGKGKPRHVPGLSIYAASILANRMELIGAFWRIVFWI
jgi:hypothetical protein